MLDEPVLQSLFEDSLTWMGGLHDQRGPKALFKRLAFFAEGEELELDEDDTGAITSQLIEEDPGNFYSTALARFIRSWDASIVESWTQDTQKHSEERRDLIFSLLDLPGEVCKSINERHPQFKPDGYPVVIAERHKEWYTTQRRQQHSFYWDAYSKYLKNQGGWPEESIIALDQASDFVVERLSDPEREEIFATKGLVVGYVQSGKTANFTAVAAKAVDAGYRFVIVIAGTLNILRAQTQRRFDKELIGRELIEMSGAQHDYIGAPDWSEFITHTGLPDELGSFNWRRMTGEGSDYRHLKHGLAALEFEGKVQGRRFNDPANLHSAEAVLVVVKKIPAVLKQLNRDLADLRTRLAEVPVLIIDDESDQATINTVDPNKVTEKIRTSTNAQIIQLVETLPRAQYIGYTATPFANVFINPDDAKDLFPKDYIISLPRPMDYMGIHDFFDFAEDGGELGEGDPTPKEDAHVRSILGGDEDLANLPKAIDAFVISGALKLFRKKAGANVSVKHHTMLIHCSVRIADHDVYAELTQKIFDQAGYGRACAYSRLEQLWKDEFKEISETLSPDSPAPKDFAALKAYIDQCLSRIGSSGSKAVRIINGDKKNEDHMPNFDRDNIWSILVGGTKLSRGYTVEGLTVSYYRRKIKVADTLMQVGRWFGFRRGYKDLVRLFVGRAEPDGRKGVFDMYTAFKSICRDEEAFRKDLEKYADPSNDPRISPSDVPPLVPSHLLPPTAKNKMRHARPLHQNFGGDWKESGRPSATHADRDRNARVFLELTAESTAADELLFEYEYKGSKDSWKSRVWSGSLENLQAFLGSYRWSQEGMMQREIEFLRGTGEKAPGISRCVVLCPQRAGSSDYTWQGMSVFKRKQLSDGAFNSFSEPRHRFIAESIAFNSVPPQANSTLKDLISTQTAVIVAYPVVGLNGGEVDLDSGAVSNSDITIGFGIKFPRNKIKSVLIYGVG